MLEVEEAMHNQIITVLKLLMEMEMELMLKGGGVVGKEMAKENQRG